MNLKRTQLILHEAEKRGLYLQKLETEMLLAEAEGTLSFRIVSGTPADGEISNYAAESFNSELILSRCVLRFNVPTESQ